MTTFAAPMCFHCARFTDEPMALKCEAFPDEIPWDILSWEHDHRTPHDGDNGILFQRKPDTPAWFDDLLVGAFGEKQYHLPGKHDQKSHGKHSRQVMLDRALREGRMTGSGTPDDPYVTSETGLAMRCLLNDKDVKLESKEQVCILLDKMADMVDEARTERGEKLYFDLCRVHVPKTNLFCEDNKGIPRASMPQLTAKPLPGSKAESFPEVVLPDGTHTGERNGNAAFTQWLVEKGYSAELEYVPVSHLKASQRELNGGTCSMITGAIVKNQFDFEQPVWISGDNYVIDGHHRWASFVWASERGLPNARADIPALKVKDLDCITMLGLAHTFAEEVGLQSSSARAHMTK